MMEKETFSTITKPFVCSISKSNPHCIKTPIAHFPKPSNNLKIYFDYIGREAQRLAAQPLGRLRYLAVILAGKYKSKLNVFMLSLGQVG
jgi:hypothetical protein